MSSIVKIIKSVFSIEKITDNLKLKGFYKILHKINDIENEISKLSDEQLFYKTSEFKEKFKSGMTIDELITPTFAIVREVSKRQLSMRHFDVQLIGGMVLNSSCIAEMKTGEGKTLVSTLAAYLNSIIGNKVHVVTVNDYLTKRDAEWMNAIYKSLNVSVGYITSNFNTKERKKAYCADILYGTNNELGFDYLRDNMRMSEEDKVQQNLDCAIIDEIDSILIDEARTPLIISDSIENEGNNYSAINKIIKQLSRSDYSIEEKDRCVFLTESGTSKIEEMLNNNGLIQKNTDLYSIENFNILHCVNQLLKAYNLFECNRDYIIKDGQIIIIDEFTGRIMNGRRYSDGLHQAIEAKENVKIHPETQTLASITFQNYFRMYKKISGMTATAATESEEFHDIYGLKVIQIPTNAPIKRKDNDDSIYKTEEEKYKATIELIKKCHTKNQPLLVGTISIEKSEKLSEMLKKENLKHMVLNAKYHEIEAHIIAQAGCPGAITIATNMAGRGTDIKLGGNVEMAFADYIKNNTYLLENKEAYDTKKQEFIEKFEKQKQEVLDSGGLYVIGTERHESRRIDNQLRGRSGRQGDIGNSKFFISLEDDLMRIFGSDKIASVLTKIGFKSGEAIEHPWINKTIQKAQKKIEGRNYDIRKNIMKFDDIVNEQRKIIFKQRDQLLIASENEILESFEAIREQANSFLVESLYSNQDKTINLNNIEIFNSNFKRLYGFAVDIENWSQDESMSADSLLTKINEITYALFKSKIEIIGEKNTSNIQKNMWLMVIGKVWSENLAYLDGLRSGIHLRAMGNKDPFIEYSKEAFESFNLLLIKIDEMCISGFSRIDVKNLEQLQFKNNSSILLNKNLNTKKDPNNKSTWGIVSRNEKCPCLSGKKYKHCCGILNK